MFSFQNHYTVQINEVELLKNEVNKITKIELIKIMAIISETITFYRGVVGTCLTTQLKVKIFENSKLLTLKIDNY